MIRAIIVLLLLGLWRPSWAAEPALRLTEVHYDPAGRDDGAEWVELANLGPTPLALDGHALGDEETPGGGEGMAAFPAGTVIAPGAVLVVAQSAQTFAARHGRPPDYEWAESDPGVPTLVPVAAWARGEVALANGGDEVLLLGPGGEVLDAMSYGDSAVMLDPPIGRAPAGQSLARRPAACDGDTAADWLPQPEPDPGMIDRDGACRQPVAATGADGPELTPIGAVQGDGPVAAAVNQRVRLRGVVTGVMEDRNAAGAVFYTIFVQDPPGSEDGDPATSDGIAIFHGRRVPPVQAGDLVEVVGPVTEYYGLTELAGEGVALHYLGPAPALPAARPLPADPDPAALEALEGMRVAQAGAATVVGPTHAGCSFAVRVGGVAGVEEPGVSAATEAGWVLPVLHASDVSCAGFPDVAVGDRVAGIDGPLVFTFDRYRLVQLDAAALAVEPGSRVPPAAAPRAGPGQLSVATFNVENLFDATADTGLDAEPVRGDAELAIKLAKLAHAVALALGCPTLVGVQEVENRPLLRSLAEALATPCGFPYDIAHIDTPDARGIDTALLFDARRVEALEVRLLQTCTALPTGVQDRTAPCAAGREPLYSRPPLSVQLRVDGQRLRVLVVHLKSKRGGAAETAPRRLEQAGHLAGVVHLGRAQARDVPVLLLGDLNDDEESAPVARLRQGGVLVDLLQHVPEAARYTYVFEGEAQQIDALMATPDLAAAVVTVTIAHVNADFPASLGLATEGTDLGYRSSDHDPALALFHWPPWAATAAPMPAPAATGTPGTGRADTAVAGVPRELADTAGPSAAVATSADVATAAPVSPAATPPLAWPWLVGPTLAPWLIVWWVRRQRARAAHETASEDSRGASADG